MSPGREGSFFRRSSSSRRRAIREGKSRRGASPSFIAPLKGFPFKGAFFRLFSLAILIRTQWYYRSPGVKKTETRLATEKDMSFSTFSWRSHRWGSLVVVGGVFCNVDDALPIDRRSIPSLSLSLNSRRTPSSPLLPAGTRCGSGSARPWRNGLCAGPRRARRSGARPTRGLSSRRPGASSTRERRGARAALRPTGPRR